MKETNITQSLRQKKTLYIKSWKLQEITMNFSPHSDELFRRTKNRVRNSNQSVFIASLDRFIRNKTNIYREDNLCEK